MGDESVKLVRRVLVLVPFSGTPDSDPEWDIAAVVDGGMERTMSLNK